MSTRRRVLVVEDHPFQRSVLVTMLRDLGVEDLVEAGDGAEALAALDRTDTAIDLMVCDLEMPGMDGVELLRRIGERGWRPAIILSSSKDRGIIEAVERMAAAYGLAVLGTFGKPPSKRDISRILEGTASNANAPVARSYPVSEHELVAALQHGQFAAVYQPLVSPPSGALVGCEALIRWHHPDHGTIPPNAFIPLAEKTGLIDRLTDFMLQEAIGLCRQWRHTVGDLRVSVNLAMGTLTDVSFPDRVAALVKAHDLEPSTLVLEVTERQVIDDLARALDCLSRLRLKGFGLAIDDFGTGFASLRQLRQMPVTELKIDRDFVHGAPNDRDRRSILESSVALARKLGLAVVAEGVEDQADWDLVAWLACNFVQGYFVARPMPPDQLLTWHRGRQSRHSA